MTEKDVTALTAQYRDLIDGQSLNRALAIYLPLNVDLF